MSLEHFKKELERLVNLFERNIDEYKDQHSSFNETQLRIQFVDPMFQAMGWDMNNVAGFAEQYKEVVHEDKVLVAGKPKAPDYSFRIGGQRKYFLEAKQPFVKIKTDYDPALQLRRYAWSGSLPISILTDFEEFAVYDTTIRPKIDDNATVSRIEYLTFREYLEKAEWIYNTFSKEAIQQGSFDKYTAKEKRGKQVVDKEFLKEIENWREWLAKDIARHNEFLTQDELNQAVQKTIDRILFLRIAEEKGIEPYKTLDNIISYKDSYPALVKYFKKAHNRYNSSLFNFEIDQISERIKISDKVLDRILQNLYYPKSPYEFSVIGVEILGSIYEQFLGKVITLTPSHNAKIEEKPEVRKAGGIYYTPQYIVNYIVENTVGELVKGKTPKEVAKLKVLDPACGSGSFLIGAYEFLLKWHIDYYNNLSPKEKEKAEKSGEIFVQVIEEDERKIDTIFLSTTLKKQILLNNIYGVDLDNQAVEVTKLSLALKMLENENNETINQQFKMNIGDERILPDMSNNIKCGNSLVGSDYWDDKDLAEITDEEIKRVNAFDWEEEFLEIFKAGGFDAVIGNPPYGRYTNLSDGIKFYLKKNHLYGPSADLSEFFIRRSLTKLVTTKTVFSFIVPKVLTYVNSWSDLRLLLINSNLAKIIDTGKSFENVRYEMFIFFVSLKKSRVIETGILLENGVESFEVPKSKFHDKFYVGFPKAYLSILDKLTNNSNPISNFMDFWYGKGGMTPNINTKKLGIRVLRGKEIGRFKVNKLKEEWFIEKHFLNSNDLRRANTSKVVIQDIVAHITNPKPQIKITATIIKQQILPLNTVMCFAEKESKIMENAFLVGLLNSDLISFYFYYFVYNQAIRTMHFMPGYADLLPIPVNYMDFQNEIVAIVNNILHIEDRKLKNSLEEKQLIRLKKELNTLVNRLYKLTDVETKIVEESIQ